MSTALEPPQAPKAAQPPSAKKPVWKRWWFWVVVVAGLWIIGMLSDGSGEPTATPVRPAFTTQAQPTTTAPSAYMTTGTDIPGYVPPPQPTSVPPAERARPSGTPQDEDAPEIWAGAPKDGTWSGHEEGDISFGAMSKPPIRVDYSYGIMTRPTLTTDNDGKTVTISSVLRVRRITEDWQYDLGNDGVQLRRVADDLPIYWVAGKEAPEHQMNEAWGTNVDVSCDPEMLKAGQSGKCTLSFEAPASEIRNSCWYVWGERVGTWPSQKAGG